MRRRWWNQEARQPAIAQRVVQEAQTGFTVRPLAVPRCTVMTMTATMLALPLVIAAAFIATAAAGSADASPLPSPGRMFALWYAVYLLAAVACYTNSPVHMLLWREFSGRFHNDASLAHARHLLLRAALHTPIVDQLEALRSSQHRKAWVEVAHHSVLHTTSRLTMQRSRVA